MDEITVISAVQFCRVAVAHAFAYWPGIGDFGLTAERIASIDWVTTAVRFLRIPRGDTRRDERDMEIARALCAAVDFQHRPIMVGVWRDRYKELVAEYLKIDKAVPHYVAPHAGSRTRVIRSQDMVVSLDQVIPGKKYMTFHKGMPESLIEVVSVDPTDGMIIYLPIGARSFGLELPMYAADKGIVQYGNGTWNVVNHLEMMPEDTEMVAEDKIRQQKGKRLSYLKDCDGG